jgi:prevent-host-death family protein
MFIMASRPLQLSEARKRLSALVERVARGGTPVAIGRYGRERAVLVGAEQYARLTRTAQRQTRPLRSIEGTMTLTCTPEELIAESRRLGELWLAAFDESSKRLTRRRRPRRK